ncbi:MAG: serine/threonine-protein kinase [Roseibacillus sp.]
MPTQSSQFRDLYNLADQEVPAKEPALDLSPLYQSLKDSKVRYTGWDSIGIGGMKEVFRVQDQQMERTVALARPKEGFRHERYDAFLREAHITARLDHPNIIKLFDMGIDEVDRPYFTMEFKRGQSLRKILSSLKKEKSRSDYPLPTRLTIFTRICEALSYAHSRHVLHLDLKPENIQIGLFGEVQVCDWGMGEIAQGDSEEHLSEALLDPDLYGGQVDPPIKGTPGYMAPEQEHHRAPKKVQNDIFSLGCLLYELTTLSFPSKREKNPPESPALAAIISKACAPLPEDRYESTQELLNDVLLHLMGRSPKVEEAGLIREARLFYQRNRVISLISAGSLLILFGFAIWFTQKLGVSYQEKAVALEKSKEALLIARQEKAQADIARHEAVDSLTKFRNERQFSSALIERQSESVLDGTLLILDNLIMDEAISLTALENAMATMDRALLEDPRPTNRLWTVKGYTLFLQQKFHDVEAFYKVREGEQGDLRALASKYAPLLQPNGLLSPDDLINLLDELAVLPDDSPSKQDRSPFMEKIVIYDSLKRESPRQTARIIERLLRIANTRWTQGKWVFDADTRSLSIAGGMILTLYRPRVPHLNSAYPSHCILRLLDLNELTLRAPNLRNYEQLHGITVRRLDIREGPKATLTPLAELENLEELIVFKDQFSIEQLTQLPKHLKIIEIENVVRTP